MAAQIDCYNVVIFGEAGAGKSSVINLIAGEEIAETSSQATGCTFENKPYRVDVCGKSLKLWDTSGLNEGEEGQMTAKQAVTNLFKLVRSLQSVSLLVYCVRGPRIKDTTVNNYKLFNDALCQREVPIVLVVTGLEQEESMGGWWRKNKSLFHKHRMIFHGQACVVATKGKIIEGIGKYMYEEEYEESRVQVRNLISDAFDEYPQKIGTIGWFGAVVKSLQRMSAGLFNIHPIMFSLVVYRALTDSEGFSNNDAREVSGYNEEEGSHRRDGAVSLKPSTSCNLDLFSPSTVDRRC